jgi:hypothetical protein
MLLFAFFTLETLNISLALGVTAVVECMLSVHKILGSLSTTTKRKQNKRIVWLFTVLDLF